MYKTLISVFIPFCFIACDNQNTREPLPPVSGIDMTAMNHAVTPGDDFNEYVNGTWIANTEIPADKSRYGVFSILADEASKNVKTIIENASKAKPDENSDEYKVGAFYKSYTDWEVRQARGLAPLKAEFNNLDKVHDYDTLIEYFGTVDRFAVTTPISMGQYVDFKDPNSYMIYLSQSGLGLPDREYYFKEGDQSESIRQAYIQYIDNMLSHVNIDDSTAKANLIFKMETRLAQEHMTKEESRDMQKNYRPVAITSLNEVAPEFNWDIYLKAEGVTDKLSNLVLFSYDYTQNFAKLLRDYSIEDWKTYMQWQLTNSLAGALTKTLDDESFNFYSTTLRGVKEQRPMWQRGVYAVNGYLGEAVGKVYVEKHFPPEAKVEMETLVDNLIKAYEISINDLDWMSAETKVQALDKLHKFTPKIGYPDKWRDYANVKISDDNLYQNIKNLRLADWQRDLDRQGGPVDRSEWAMNPQTVNAYYNPPLNEIVFPAAILQPPFFNLNADSAVNYGAIGAVIGHEIGHGFDDKGSAFDGNGQLRNWWTETDKAEFDKRTSKLIDQYNSYYPLEDLHVNGEFTLGENIGDLGGLSIGLKAYQLSMTGTEAPIIDGFTGVQRVFLGYAQVWRMKSRDEALRAQIETDPHSPAMYRVNGIVRNVPEFYDAFNVTSENTLYLPPEERVKIW